MARLKQTSIGGGFEEEDGCLGVYDRWPEYDDSRAEEPGIIMYGCKKQKMCRIHKNHNQY